MKTGFHHQNNYRSMNDKDVPNNSGYRAAIETVQSHFALAIALLPEGKRPSIIPQTSREGIPVVKEFLKPELIQHIDGNPALVRSLRAAYRQEPLLIHKVNAARQAAMRHETVCPVTKADVTTLFTKLDVT